MAYTLEQIYGALGSVENGGQMVADLQDALRSAREEAAKSRVERNKVLDALKLRDSGNVDASLQQILTTLQAVQNVGGDPSALGEKLDTLQKSLAALQEKYTASERKAKEEHDKRVQTAIQSQLLAALAKGNAVKPDAMLRILKDNVVVGDDDSLSYKAGAKTVGVDEGVSGWLKENPWAVQADVQTGAGGGSAGPSKTYTMDDLKGMSREEINAHWDEISKTQTAKGAET